MLRVLRADKDAYITDRVIDGARVYDANTGKAGTLDLFKLYGATTTFVSGNATPNTELSRLLVHFDLTQLFSDVQSGKIDPVHGSFSCTLKLFDVYGGQPCPEDFYVNVNPLSRSFDEGLGRDVVLYADRDRCNFLSASHTSPWVLSGAGEGGDVTGTVDYITGATIDSASVDFTYQQHFVAGTEDLSIDVTTAIRATLSGDIPDAGFRVALAATHEQDNQTYFVKRFAARGAYNESKRPALWVTFDDSILDDTLRLELDEPATLWLYNFSQSRPTNIVSGTSQLTGTDCIALTLSTSISGGIYSASFTGSQHFSGVNAVVGFYSASVTLSSTTPEIAFKLAQTGSVDFTPTWHSLDGTIAFFTGSVITAHAPDRGMSLPGPKQYNVTSLGIPADITNTTPIRVRVNIFDQTTAYVKRYRVPIVLPGSVVRDVHWSLRDPTSDVVIIPFDQVNNSTRVSSDGSGMYFTLDAANVATGNLYTIDILVDTGGSKQVFKSTCAPFRVRASL